MTQPELTEAPLEWLETVCQDTVDTEGSASVRVEIVSKETGETWVFSYPLKEIRSELQKRKDS